jgi:tRNA A37 threonylcarbamoyladenosine synthetase subunit TsaC/SUA5/YrdC
VKTILAQTDTTVGFLSQDAQKLYEIKSRKTSKPFIKVYQNFKTFLDDGNRVPPSKKNLVRRSKKTTFIVKNKAFRVAKISLGSKIIRDSNWYYSTSANKAGENFDREFCESKADIIIEDKDGLYEDSASILLKINKRKIVRVR